MAWINNGKSGFVSRKYRESSKRPELRSAAAASSFVTCASMSRLQQQNDCGLRYSQLVICLRRLCTRRIILKRFLLVSLIGARVLIRQTPTAITLASSANPSILGQSVTLTASVTPAQVAGRVTFYGGSAVLGTAAVAKGSVSLSTILPSSGVLPLTARFIGSGTYGSSVSNVLEQTVSPIAAQTLQSPVSYATANAINQHVAVADFNGDGHLDIVTNNYTVLLGNGDGTFRAGATISSSSNAYAVATGDFNGDGKQDFAAARIDGSLGVYLGNGDGTFSSPILAATGTGPRDLATGDFNQDGIVDIAIVSRQGIVGVSILLGVGDGTFQPIKTYLAGQRETALSIADVNGDGSLDIIAVDSDDLSNNITILLGAGDGTFRAGTTYDAGFPQIVATGDFNRDGKPDFVVASFFNNYFTVFLGNGDGTFTMQSPPPVTPSADPLNEQFAVADFDGDGIPDIAWAGESSTGVSIYIGIGNGTFRGAVDFPAGGSSGSLIAADFNGDGRADLAVTNTSSIQILLAATGTFPTVTTTSIPTARGGAAYSSTLAASGGSEPYTWSLSAGTIPLVLSPSGVLSGTPSANSAGTDRFSVMVSGPGGPGFYSGQTLSLGVSTAFQIDTQYTFADGKVGSPYTAPLVASGGTPPYLNWTVTSGTLPPGLSLNPASGSISGTPTGSGTFTCTITVNDSTGLTSSAATVSIEIVGALAFVTASLPSGFTSVPYYAVLQGSGGFPPYKNWTVVSGALPPGLSLDPTQGVISGTPTTTLGSPFAFAITFSDSSTVSPPQPFTIPVSNPAGTVTLTTSANPSPFGQPLTLTATVPGGSGKATFYDGVTVLGTAAIDSGQATIATSLLQGGVHTLKATSFAPPASAAVSEVISATADASLLAPVTYVMPSQEGTEGNSIVVADFNGDGKADIATFDAVGLNFFISVRLGNGDGTFAAPLMQSIPAGTTLNSMVAGDFNEDGNIDLAMPGPTGLILYFGNGDGTFSSGASLSLSGPGPGAYLAAADFNGDGHTDFVFTNRTSQTQILLGIGDGTFRPALTAPISFSPVAIAVGDFNGDGNPDLAIGQASPTASNSASGSINILLGNGDGTFRTPVSWPVTAGSSGAWSIIVSDLNRDGNADLAISGPVANTVDVMLGKGDGTFGAVASYALAGCCDALTAGDFNADGIPDLVAPGQTVSSVTLLLGNGDGSFRAASSYGTGDNGVGYSPAIGDFNGDGLPDIALALTQGGIDVLFGSAVTGANQLTLSPDSVEVNGGSSANPPSQTVTLTYQTTERGNYTFNSSSGIENWVSVSPASGPMTLASSSSPLNTYTANVNVGFSSAALFPGDFYAGALYFGVNGTPAKLPVSAGNVTTKITAVVNAASAAQATPSVVSTGSYIAIYGSALADSASTSASSLPLPTILNGAQVTLGGVNMPLLYAAGGQIDAIVPQGLSPNNSYPLLVMNASGGVLAAQLSVLVKELQPAIYTVDSSGSGPGVIANNSSGQLITASNPAQVSDYLVIYCTGLGPLVGANGEPQPADGVPAPTDLIFNTKAEVEATVGGVDAPVLFSGLTPKSVGLYQVNIQVPAGVVPGAAVPVVISTSDRQTGASGQSNSVTIAIR